LLDQVTKRAKLIGAVNTVYRRGDRLVGDNTDATGFLRALRDAGFRPRGARVLVVGAGGAARAVVAALHDSGARAIHVVNRSPARRRSVAGHFARAKVVVSTGGLEDLRHSNRLAGVRLIVNTTSIGWHDETFPSLDFEATDPGCLFHDLVYGKSTNFLERARSAGRPTLDGLSMLLHQGAAAFSLWTGRRAPLDVMSRALRQHTASRVPIVARDKS
jgi:shikimate dehydrogenase